ncbi:Type IV secretory pathway, VirD4 component, TraG/TraD family ATPase [Raineyella antarctica]|uniref:Type IV secretory pathway, VirD4 component, TraG/TraD family ATPase n=1 Tax=Raineyella antarctica TaxID=1577474 RepID=A0A1G6HL97_9ACTN|nr:TraM recognition domain-containing protein [Raineyella antarctica]SDB94933.1 Type IV secretory pathway, VirD4 component, TraG/TraD family ATPase [Raineyella antarctica]
MTNRLKDNRARRQDPAGEERWLWALGAVAVIMVIWGTLWGSGRLLGSTKASPGAYLAELTRGLTRIGPGQAALTLLVLTGISAGVVVGIRALRSLTAGRTRVDGKAASMAHEKDLISMLPAGARADAERLGATRASDGVPVGKLIPGGAELRSSWEWVQVWIMGPRAGKTSCVCVPQLLETAGPALATTNKRDLVDQTRGPRALTGTVWVFDPQNIIGEEPSWWWNPLSYVTGIAQAEEMAALFAAASKDTDARTDAYFDTAATNYLACLLLAAATGDEPITTVYRWASNPDDEDPALILRMAGHSGPATTLFAIIALSERQRDGVIGTAAKMITWLTNPDLLPWITPSTGGTEKDRPQFRPDQFVRSTQTLYLVSMEGRGTARAIAAALTVAVVRAGETYASHSPAGRLPVPLMVILDEAANVVRWPDLPDLYSHFGSRGIVISTFLQSWNQGVAAWGRDGMEKLWSAANLRVIGAGIAQADFLTNTSRLIGDHDIIRHDTSTSGKSAGLFDSGRSTSTRLQREAILEPAELASLPRGRAIMLSSGAPAALVELVHWSQTDHAEAIRASETYYSKLAAVQE